jgi:hypothetical protein
MKMNMWTCNKIYENAQTAILQKWWWNAKKPHHQETQEFSLRLKYKLCDCDHIKKMV